MARHSGVTLRSLSLLTLLGLVLVACGSPGDGGSDATTTSAADSSTTTTSAAESATTTIGETEMPDENQVVESALADLASREGVSLEDISIVRVEPIDWPDASLGCPDEGMSYAQVIVPGFKVLLQIDERVFDYHAGTNGEVFLCPSDEKDGGYDFVPPPGIDT